MTRIKSHRIAAAIALAGAVALAAAATVAGGTGAARASAAAGTSLLDTLTLMRWGQGALDWTLPDAKGDRHASNSPQRA